MTIKTTLTKTLLTLTVLSTFVLSTTPGYSAAAGDLDLAIANERVRSILKEAVPVTPQVQQLASRVIKEEKKIFISYCWDRKYSTAPMVEDFVEFIKGRGIKEYYWDKSEEPGYGMTPGVKIEDFMQNASKSDVVVVFLNDAYLRSYNCMKEFFQVWNIASKEMYPKALIIRHPDFGALFERGDAAAPYRQSWADSTTYLNGKYIQAPPLDRDRLADEMSFSSKVEANITSIVNAIAGHIQPDYSDLRASGFEVVFKVALREEDEEKEEPAAQVVPAPQVQPVAQALQAGKYYILSSDRTKCYLTVNGKVSSGDYQWAFFGTLKYLNADKAKHDQQPEMSLRQNDDGTYFIQSNWGETSFLGVNGTVSRGSYQRAFFGTLKYLNADKAKYGSSSFKLIKNPDGTYFIQSNWGETSFLAIDGLVQPNSYQWAFFGTDDYINENAKYTKKLKITLNMDD
jgi:hypothetical protein